jgi:hypothetical protein
MSDTPETAEPAAQGAPTVTPPRRRRPRARPEHYARSIPDVLRRLRERGCTELTESQLRRAIMYGEIKTTPFAGLLRIPQSEEDRLVNLLAGPAAT